MLKWAGFAAHLHATPKRYTMYHTALKSWLEPCDPALWMKQLKRHLNQTISFDENTPINNSEYMYLANAPIKSEPPNE